MSITFLDAPKFYKAQLVYFVGGEGIVCSSHSEAGRWTYLIEMALGPEPTCGRVEAETTVLLNKADLRAVDYSQSKATKV